MSTLFFENMNNYFRSDYEIILGDTLENLRKLEAGKLGIEP
jgi:hypothetical protein